jgi:hypothetical protein
MKTPVPAGKLSQCPLRIIWLLPETTKANNGYGFRQGFESIPSMEGMVVFGGIG